MGRREFLFEMVCSLLSLSSMMGKPNIQPSRTCLWQLLGGVGLERCALVQEHAGWKLRGTILRLSDGAAAEVHYTILCDGSWRTVHAEIGCLEDEREHHLVVSSDNGRWHSRGQEIGAVHGCVDVDLAWTPSTNTLPIRRLNLRTGETSGPMTVAWIQFPKLTIAPLSQEYTRTSESQYRYTRGSGAFAATIDVDESGLIVKYQNAWQRVSDR